jgi:hypothetical protein
MKKASCQTKVIELRDFIATKAELSQAVYTGGKLIYFQSHLGQAKVVFDNQGKNELLCIKFSIRIFVFKSFKCMHQKIERACEVTP